MQVLDGSSMIWGGIACLALGIIVSAFGLRRRRAARTRPAFTPLPEAAKSASVVTRPTRAVGLLAVAGRPVPAAQAFVMALSRREARLSAPLKRSEGELKELFEARYQRRFGDGVVIESDGALPSGPRELLDECCAALEPYGRWLGRKENAVAPLSGLSLLPSELLQRSANPALRKLRLWIAEKLGGSDSAKVAAKDLANLWLPAEAASSLSARRKLEKRDAVMLAQLLEKLGCGIEPDVRFGGPVLDHDQDVAIFRLPEGAPRAPSAEYAAASVLVQLAAAVSGADADVSEAEEQHLVKHLETALDLEPAERARLAASWSRLRGAARPLAGLQKRVASLDASERESVGRFLIGVAGADGRISSAEIRTLEKIYSWLGLDSGDLYGDVHDQSIDSKGGQATSEKRAATQSGASRGVVLDMVVVQKRIAESAAVSALLSEIFVEDEATNEAPLAPARISSAIGCVQGLDESRSAFLRALPAKPSWPRDDLERLASEHGVLLDGCLETINDLAFERCNAPAWEGDDPIEVNLEALKELLQA